MPNLNPRRFSNPDTLNKVKRECLLDWLANAKDYLTQRGLSLPSPKSGDAVDCERLAGILMDPEGDIPEKWAESLFLINEMADPQGMDAILDGCEQQSISLDAGEDPEPADVAVQAWLADPNLLEQIHNEHQLTRPRSFLHFLASAPQALKVPSAEQLKALEARLDNWYAKRKRGRGCRVMGYPRDGECWFLVRHGLPCKREGSMDGGQPASVFYRPQKHDVVVYSAADGELRIHCDGVRERDELRKAFGLHLFSNEEHFPGTAKYTFTPLTGGPGCLECGDVEGMESVTLKEVAFVFGGKPWKRVTTRSDDVYALVEKGWFKWPDAERICRAVYEIKFVDSKRPRRLTLAGSNQALYTRDGDSELVERWLKARDFIRNPEELDDALEEADE